MKVKPIEWKRTTSYYEGDRWQEESYLITLTYESKLGSFFIQLESSKDPKDLFFYRKISYSISRCGYEVVEGRTDSILKAKRILEKLRQEELLDLLGKEFET